VLPYSKHPIPGSHLILARGLNRLLRRLQIRRFFVTRLLKSIDESDISKVKGKTKIKTKAINSMIRERPRFRFIASETFHLQAGLKVGAFSATCVISSYVMYEVIDLYGSIPRFNKLLAMIDRVRVGELHREEKTIVDQRREVRYFCPLIWMFKSGFHKPTAIST